MLGAPGFVDCQACCFEDLQVSGLKSMYHRRMEKDQSCSRHLEASPQRSSSCTSLAQSIARSSTTLPN